MIDDPKIYYCKICNAKMQIHDDWKYEVSTTYCSSICLKKDQSLKKDKPPIRGIDLKFYNDNPKQYQTFKPIPYAEMFYSGLFLVGILFILGIYLFLKYEC